MPTSYSLFEVNEYIKRVVALNFQEPIWVRCEISQASFSRGSVYLTVVQQDEESQELRAQSQAVIWPRNYLFLKNKLGELLSYVLEAGTEVMMKVTVDYHERYGMKLTVEDIDASYTLGQAEMARQKIIERLKKDNLLQLNDLVPLPSVIQYVAVISSERAAGYQDFKHQLESNDYGYDYYVELYDSAVQGRNVESEVLSAMKRIHESEYLYDAIVIIRGGGSKLDLGGFDNYNIAHAIAHSEYPVIVGIGHEVDTTVTDLVAKLSVKTPTAAAEYLINRNMQYEARILDLARGIQQQSTQLITRSAHQMDMAEYKLEQVAKEVIQDAQSDFSYLSANLRSSLQHAMNRMKQALDSQEMILKALDPQRTLKRGYAIVRKEGKSIDTSKEVKSGDQLSIEMADGQIETTVN